MKIAEQQRVHKEGQYDPFYWDSSVVVSDNLGKRLSSFGQRPNAESWPIEHILKCYYIQEPINVEECVLAFNNVFLNRH